MEKTLFFFIYMYIRINWIEGLKSDYINTLEDNISILDTRNLCYICV